MLDLYVNIRKFRKENRMSQEELAKKVGYTDRSTIARIEKGEIDLPQSKIALFARALGVSSSVLMGNTGLTAAPSDLSPDEREVLEAYRSLNDSGRKKLIERGEELLALGYQRDVSVSFPENGKEGSEENSA